MFVAKLIGMLVAFPLVGCASLQKSNSDLLFYCSFDSERVVATPEIGPSPSFMENVALVDGVRKKALSVTPLVPCLSIPLPAGFLGSRGCIEFWGKIEKETDFCCTDGGDPRFFCIKWEKCAEALVDMTTNNGGGRGGLHAMVPGVNLTSHLSLGRHTYSELLAESDWKSWKHYALVWNEDGIRSLPDAPRVALLINGKVRKLHGSEGHVDLETLLRQTATLDIPRNPVNGFPDNNKTPFLIDEFKIWKTDKTDFAN